MIPKLNKLNQTEIETKILIFTLTTKTLNHLNSLLSQFVDKI